MKQWGRYLIAIHIGEILLYLKFMGGHVQTFYIQLVPSSDGGAASGNAASAGSKKSSSTSNSGGSGGGKYGNWQGSGGQEMWETVVRRASEPRS